LKLLFPSAAYVTFSRFGQKAKRPDQSLTDIEALKISGVFMSALFSFSQFLKAN